MKHALSYDTVYMRHPMSKVDAQAIVERVEREHPEEQEKKSKRVLYKKMELRASMWGLHIKNSLARMHKGNNMLPLSLTECAWAIEELSDVTGIDVSACIVTRVDVCGDIELHAEGQNDINSDDYSSIHIVPVSDYLATLGKRPGYNKKDVNGETVTYYSRLNNEYDNEKLQLEDKMKEMRDHKRDVPPEAEGKNIVRIELSLYGRSRIERLNGGTVTASTLTEEQFYRKVCERWHDIYKGILYKTSRVSFTHRPTTAKELEDGLKAIGLGASNGGYIDSIIRDMIPSERNKCNRTLIPNIHGASVIGSHEFRDELDRGVEQLYAEAVR